MHHQPDIGLIYPHAESVRRRNDAQVADTKPLLNVAFLLGGQAGMKVLSAA